MDTCSIDFPKTIKLPDVTVVISISLRIRSGDSPWLVLWAIELDGIKYRQKKNYGWERWVENKNEGYLCGHHCIGDSGHYRSVSSKKIIERLDTFIAKYCLNNNKENPC